jgi:putative MFS transporter
VAAAVTIDLMKPTTLAFVVPGMAEEYGLRSALHPDGDVPVAIFPLCALVGMVVGSFAWGRLGDRIGRRASILGIETRPRGLEEITALELQTLEAR